MSWAIQKISNSRQPTRSVVCMSLLAIAIGCESSEEPVAKTQPAPVQVALSSRESGATSSSGHSTAEQIEDPQEETDDKKDMLKQASDLFNRAKDSKGGSVKDAADWVKQKLGDAAESGDDSADEAMDWATQMYESLKDQGMTSAGSASEWVANDWKNMGAWNYKVVKFDASETEEIESKLNELGEERWECFHVQSVEGRSVMYFKKPARSYLKNIPLKDMLRLIPMLDGVGAGE